MDRANANQSGVSSSNYTRLVGSWLNKLKWCRRATFYPAEYILMLSTSLSLIFVTGFLGASVIADRLDQPMVNFVAPGVVYLVASAIVTLPVHLVFYWRVRHTDRRSLSQTAQRVAHAALGVYLFIVVSVLVSLATWLVYGWLNLALNFSDYSKSLLAASLGVLHAMIWLKYSAWHFVRARASRSRPRNYVLIVGLVTVVLITLSLIYPAQNKPPVQKNTFPGAGSSYYDNNYLDYNQYSNPGTTNDDLSNQIQQYLHGN